MVSLDTSLSKCGLAVIAFPSNQFGDQEPKTNAEIKEFVKKYGVEFPMMAKVDVNGPDTCDVWADLKSVFPGTTKWNFDTKFLVARNGTVIRRYDGLLTPALTPIVTELVCADAPAGCC
ncbi:thioredoxin-like protein [Baffinella frigidus]|nr:thioredoxin-like protein [Cryptophyta sp. CCMP2293]|mmetsp:Transcript_67189/g.160299  ORF Transcript_67189/g.160299 Transcript_67189/m.160299 type:complete len:119 (-) Transcript_67189:189-545(-)